MFDSFKAKVQQGSATPSPPSGSGYTSVPNVITPLKDSDSEKESVEVSSTSTVIGGVKLSVQKISHLLVLTVAALSCVNGVLLVRQLRFAPFLLGVAVFLMGFLVAAVELFQNLTEGVNEYFKLWNSVSGRGIAMLVLCLVTMNQPTNHLARLLSLAQLLASLGWWALLLISSSELPVAMFKLNFPLFNRRGRGEDNSPIYLSEKY